MPTGLMQTDTVLDRIVTQTASDVVSRKQQVSGASLITAIERSNRPPLLLAEALNKDHIAVIAEVKRGSPSRGVFPVDVDPRSVAADYISGGAAAISCLTDGPFFHGSQQDLEAVVDVAHQRTPMVPVIRKDFVIDPYQLLEAKAWGADAVLLIVAALEDDLLAELFHRADQLGLSTLVEVHDERETERALRLASPVLGVNNRNLKTFEVDLQATERVSPLVPAGTLLVSESGIFTSDDVRQVAEAGADAVLVGESVIVQEDRSRAVSELVRVPRMRAMRGGT